MLRRVSSSSTLSTLPQTPRLSFMKAGSSGSPVSQCGTVLERVCDSFEVLITRDKAITCNTASPSPSVTHATTDDADNTESRDHDSECNEYASTSYPPSLGNCDGCDPNFSGTRWTGCGARQETLIENNDIIQTKYTRQYSASKQMMDISSERSRLIDDTSCSHSEVTMWYPTAGTEGVSLHDCWEEESTEDSSNSLHLCDMLCGISPRIIEHGSEEMRTEDILRWHRRVPHTIIIDSDNLDAAPHIVITPPEEPSWMGFCTAQANRVPMQSMSHLVSPPLFAETGRMHSYWELMEVYYPPAPLDPILCTDTTDDLLSTRLPGAPLVFNHEDFRLSKKRSEEERLSPSTRDITFVILRYLFKATAIVASMSAGSFRERYDIPGFCESIERSFEWTDPAEPILARFTSIPKRSPIILHSLYPLTVPHIIIHEAPSNDPWITFGNAVDVQDHCFGNSLVVASSRFSQLQYINPAMEETHHVDDEQERFDEDESSDCFSDASSSFTSCPPTPQTELHRVGSSFFIEFCDDEKEEEITVFVQENDSMTDSFSVEGEGYEHDVSSYVVYSQEVKRKFFIDEDEEDGPPEWDDWFISAAARARDVETAESPLSSTCS